MAACVPKGLPGRVTEGVTPGVGRGLARLGGYVSLSLSSGALLSGGWSSDEPTWWVQLRPPPGGSLDPCPCRPADASTRTGQGPLCIISLSLDTPLSRAAWSQTRGPGSAGPAEEGRIRWKGVGEGRQVTGETRPFPVPPPRDLTSSPHRRPRPTPHFAGSLKQWCGGRGGPPWMQQTRSPARPLKLELVCLLFRQHLGQDYERE